MAYEFRLPDLGEGMEEATIVKWLVRPGDIVKKDQNIVEVETDKAIVSIPSPYEGKVISTNFREGETAKVGSVLIRIGSEKAEIEIGDVRAPKPRTEGTVAGVIEKDMQAPKPWKESTPGKTVVAAPRIRRLARELGVELIGIAGSGTHGEITEADVRAAASKRPSEIRHIRRDDDIAVVEKRKGAPAFVEIAPKARELASKAGIDIGNIGGTGPGGSITVRDVEEAVKRTESVVELKKIGRAEGVGEISGKISHPLKGEISRRIEKRVPIRGLRKSIIKKLAKSNALAVQAVAMEEIDVTGLVDLRNKEKVGAERRGIKLTYMPFIIKACVIALKRHPWLNSSMDDERKEFVLKEYYNIGIAIDTDDGLIVPVIKNVEMKSIMDIAEEIGLLAERARKRELALDELSGGTFTISNWGSIGCGFGTPVLNYPECAILGVGRIAKKPTVVAGDKVEVRHIMPISLTFDHRIIDGAQAARFVMELKKHLEDPALLLVEIV